MANQKELSVQELEGYLKTAIDLEASVATQQSIIQCYDEKAQSIKPYFQPEEKPNQPYAESKEEFKFDMGRDSAEPTLLVFGILCAVGGLFLFGVNVWAALGCIAFGLVLLAPMIMRSRKINAKNQEKDNRYNDRMARYQAEVARIDHDNAERKSQYTRDFDQWNRNYSQNMAALNKPLAETQKVLSNYYSDNVIYEKYRNLPALTSMYEYFITGRCEALSGPHGAYNMYEDEVRKDLVISQLNTVIQNLEQIKQNQYKLYQEVKGIQGTMAKVSYDINQIRGYTANILELSAVSAYYAQVTAMNTEISAAYHILNG